MPHSSAQRGPVRGHMVLNLSIQNVWPCCPTRKWATNGERLPERTQIAAATAARGRHNKPSKTPASRRSTKTSAACLSKLRRTSRGVHASVLLSGTIILPPCRQSCAPLGNDPGWSSKRRGTICRTRLYYEGFSESLIVRLRGETIEGSTPSIQQTWRRHQPSAFPDRGRVAALRHQNISLERQSQ